MNHDYVEKTNKKGETYGDGSKNKIANNGVNNKKIFKQEPETIAKVYDCNIASKIHCNVYSPRKSSRLSRDSKICQDNI